MADKETEYKFKIDVFTPKTIPMLRLGEYMAELAKLLANTTSVHFDRLEESSCVLVSKIEWEAAPKVRSRIESIKRSEAADDATEAVARLNVMLREDNAVGKLLQDDNGKLAEILHFPGREIPKPEQIGPFSEQATIKAQLYRIGGRDDTAHAQLMDSAGRQWNGKLTKEQAAKMAAAGGEGLYKWFLVNGSARWLRTEENEWKLVDFHINDFKLLQDASLEEDIAALRGIKGNQWGDVADPSGAIKESRSDDDEVH
ncbi:MAG: hypothetical protein AABM33_05975 [Pseudomonadota bacterium]